MVLAAFAAVVGGGVVVEQPGMAQQVDILKQADVITGFGYQQKRKARGAELLDEGLLGVEAVGDDNCGHARVVGAEPLQHAVAGLQFAILLAELGAVGVTVAHELGSEGEHLALVGVDDGGLQDVMVIVFAAARERGQAVLTVDGLGVEIARAVEGDEIAGVEDLEVLEPLGALQAADEVGKAGHEGLIVMAVEEVAELRVDGDLADTEGGGEVVGLELLLEAALELQQGGVLDEEQSEGTEVTIAQGVANFAELAGVADAGHMVGHGVDEGAETK